MIIKLCKNLSDKIVANKDIKVIREINGSLLNDCSLSNPVISVANIGDIISQINYVEIPEFNRKYYIEDKVYINNKLFELHLKRDTLTSLYNEFVNLDCLVARNENLGNLDIEDERIKFKQHMSIQTISFKQGFKEFEIVVPIAGN